MRPLNIAVLMGGISSEREISLRSGNAVAKALKEVGNNVICIDVKDENIEEIDHREIDVAFIALHGYFGEDGGVQQLLEAKGIPYTGSGVDASKIAMDKLESKKYFLAAGIKTPEYFPIKKSMKLADIESKVKEFGFPVVIKQTNGGSSIGVSIIKNDNNLHSHVEKALRCGDEVFVERYVSGRELTVGILDNRALPIIEIIVSDIFFDYNAKYRSDKTRYFVIKKNFKDEINRHDNLRRESGFLDAELYDKAQELAIEAHNAIGCRGFSRVDMLLDNKNDFYILEINTIPGFTEKSLLPMAARASDISFTTLCEKIVDLALQNSFVSIDGSIKN
ncbi:MAG: D-alanine--D-alanine ligase [Candidatus Kuenenia sp.]|nr:D-alanine--D-alanine ligase [Candidatus Kuenenia hertensis]